MIHMLKTLDVVAAIIERNGQILLAQRPPHADQPGMWELVPAVKSNPAKPRPRRWRASSRRSWRSTPVPECYIASHQREVSARLIHLHAWWVPHFNGEPIARYHSQLRWCSPQEALTFPLAPADIPLLEAFIAQRAALHSR